MAKQTRKIKRKITPEEIKEENSLKPKEGKDRMLLILIAVTALIMALGYETMDGLGMGMYSSMMGAMICLYLSRHGSFDEKVLKILHYASFVFIGFVMILMVCNFVFNFNW